MRDIITLDHGSGGKKTAKLIEDVFLEAFGSPELAPLADGAVLALTGPLVFSTDSFVIAPYVFPGGDIGKLSVCGTVNDLCMCGGEPRYLSVGMILEEGLPLDDLLGIAHSIGETARACGVRIATGDTKVVERGRGDGVYINTAGIGTLRYPGLTPKAIRPGDAILISGTLGDHAAAVMLARGELGLGGNILSDCAPLTAMCASLCACPGVRALRDPTRGGAATVLCEFAEQSGLCMELSEERLPVRPDVRAACALLGLDPLYCANEGKLIAVVEAAHAQEALAALRATPGGENAVIAGNVTQRGEYALLHTQAGGTRILNKLSGAQLPRIC